LQLRGGSEQPSRNFLSTWQTARLLCEIYSLQAVAPSMSQKMQRLMERPPGGRSRNWAGFLGAALPRDALVMGKEGQTSTTRHDGVIVTRSDGPISWWSLGMTRPTVPMTASCPPWIAWFGRP